VTNPLFLLNTKFTFEEDTVSSSPDVAVVSAGPLAL
jgi:hypothetical protein